MNTTTITTTPRRRLIAIAAVLVAGLAPAAASADPPAGVPHAQNRVTAEAWAAGRAALGRNATAEQAVDAYWTPARMRAAKPADGVAAGEPAAASAARVRRQQAKGKPFSVPPVRGRMKPRARPAAYNPNVNYWTQTAYLNGKVFFNRGGSSRVCSGAIVNTEGKSSVWTAGHCLYDQGQWASNWVFVPAYDDDLSNPRPYGTWWSKYLTVASSWYSSRYYGSDYGVATMWPSSSGWRIADYFGGQGFVANQSRYVSVYAFGYPSASPFDGGNLFGCSGDARPTWDYRGQGSNLVSDYLYINCDMTPGASGGPWLRWYNGNSGYLNGISSVTQASSTCDAPPCSKVRLQTGYFGDEALRLYNGTRYSN